MERKILSMSKIVWVLIFECEAAQSLCVIWCLSSKWLPIQPSMSDLLALDRFYDLQNQILFHSYKNTKILSSEISGEEYCFLLFRQLEKKRPKFAFESYQLCLFFFYIKKRLSRRYHNVRVCSFYCKIIPKL